MIDLTSDKEFTDLCKNSYRNVPNYPDLITIIQEKNSLALRYFIEDELDKYDPYVTNDQQKLEEYKMNMVIYSYMMNIIDAQLENGEKEFT